MNYLAEQLTNMSTLSKVEKFTASTVLYVIRSSSY